MLPASFAKRDQQYLIYVELTAEPPPRRTVEGDRAISVRDRPAELARVRAVGQPPCGTEELEDVVPPAVDACNGSRPGHFPDCVLGDHLEEGARISAAERVEDATDVRWRIYCSKGAIVSP